MRAVDATRHDVRYALRMMRRSPGFTAVAVLSLAFGIGANTAIFSVINAVMLRQLPVRDPEQLVELLSRYPGEPRMNYFGWKYYEHYRDRNSVFSELIGTAPARFHATGDGFAGEAIHGEYVVGAYFRALGVRPAIGRLIGPEDDRPGATEPAVVVSWSCWRRRFNLDPAILGRRIALNGVAATVVGVAPRGFVGLQIGRTWEVWVPAAVEPLLERPSRSASGRWGLQLIARLKPGVSLEQARTEMTALDRLRVEEIASRGNDPLWRQTRLELAPAAAGLSGLRDQLGQSLLALMVIVVVLLSIACTNVASLLLARSAARRREIGVRVALGAARGRLVRQLITESLLLSAAGSAIGLLIAYFGADALVRAWPLDVRGWPERPELQVHPDSRVLLFTTSIAVLTGILFGLAPAWNAFASSASSSLREIGIAGETRSRRIVGRSLIVAQVGLSVLLSAAGLFVRHLSNLRNVDLGFDRRSVLLVTLDPSQSGYSREQLSRMYRELLERLQTLPGVRSATVSAVTPVQGGAALRFVRVEGFQEDNEARRYVSLNWIGPRYFETFGTRWMAGRDFGIEDEGRQRVAIVNRSFAAHYFGDTSAIGKRFTFDGESRPYEIVGTVADAKYSSLHEPAPRTIYLHAFQEGLGRFSQFSLRTAVPPATVAGDVRRAVQDVLKNVPVARVRTLGEQVDGSTVQERLIATLSGFFAALGAALAALGIYGLLAYTVARRTREIGIRVALGATSRTVKAMVLKSAAGLVCAGLAVGVPLAFAGRRFAASLIQNVPVEPAIPIALAAAAMIALALIAAYVPARRAARVNPIEVLRSE